MEHAQRGCGLKLKRHTTCCRLNPYFNGTCSKRKQANNVLQLTVVSVLILILMEHAQRDFTCMDEYNKLNGLNPYFNGTCSKRKGLLLSDDEVSAVLILILMEHAQRGYWNKKELLQLRRLNPYFNGTCSKRETLEKNDARIVCRLNPYFNGTCSKRAFFIRPSVLICYIETFTLINAFASEKCTCFLLKTLQR